MGHWRYGTALAGALYELDRRQAQLDNAWLDWKRKNARNLKEG